MTNKTNKMSKREIREWRNAARARNEREERQRLDDNNHMFEQIARMCGGQAAVNDIRRIEIRAARW